MTGFKLRTSGIESNRTTTAQIVAFYLPKTSTPIAMRSTQHV